MNTTPSTVLAGLAIASLNAGAPAQAEGTR